MYNLSFVEKSKEHVNKQSEVMLGARRKRSRKWMCSMVDKSFEVLNGLKGLMRDILLRIFHLIEMRNGINSKEKDFSIRSLIGICQNNIPWKSHSYFIKNRIKYITRENFRTFEEMRLRDETLRGVYAYGLGKPAAVQRRAIFAVVRGRDVVVQAPCGAGKKTAVAIAMLEKVSPNENTTQALILAPTRELVNQLFHTFNAIGKCISKVRVTKLVSKEDVGEQIRTMKEKRPHIIVGTPGRVGHMILVQALQTDRLKTVVILEAEDMIEYFEENLKEIGLHLPSGCGRVLLCAVQSKKLAYFSARFLRNPHMITIDSDRLSRMSLEYVRQFYIAVGNEDNKPNALVTMYQAVKPTSFILFCSAVQTALCLVKLLTDQKCTVGVVFEGMERNLRRMVLRDFWNGLTRALISTVVLFSDETEVDVSQISLVINYDLPMDKELYMRRIGKREEFRRRGIAVNLVSDGDFKAMQNIREFYSTSIEEVPIDFRKYLHT